MAVCRAIVRLGRLIAGAMVRYTVWLTGDLLRRSRPKARRAWRTRCVRSWARAAARAVGLRLHVQGGSPAAPFLLVSNHLGYVDILVLAALAEGRFVARHDIGDWPLIGLLVKAGGTILVKRDRRTDAAPASAAMREAFEEGSGVILFPEGTSTDGHHVLPFRSSLFEPAVTLRRPVHTAALAYSTPPGSPDAANAVCWWGDMSFAPHLWKMLQLPWIDAHVAFGQEPLTDVDRKKLSAAAHDAVVALHDDLNSRLGV